MEDNNVVTNGKKSSSKLIITIIAIVAIIAIVCGIICAVKSSPEKTVKTFLKNIENKKASKIVDQMDIVGLGAWSACYGKYKDFEDKYDEYKEEYDDLDKDEINEQLDSMKEELEDSFENVDKIKIDVKKMKSAKKVSGTKNLYKVNTKMKVTTKVDDDKESDTTTVDFYVYKVKGKYYIVGMDTKSGNGLDLF